MSARWGEQVGSHVDTTATNGNLQPYSLHIFRVVLSQKLGQLAFHVDSRM